MSATLPPKRATDARVADAAVASMFVERWSRRAFAERPVSREHVRSLFEAARWTPSASNLQPWLFVYADDAESLARARPILFDSNRRWADKAPLLIFAFARNRHPTRNVVNHTSAFDTGAAWMAIALQAHALGLVSHAMGGFHHELAHDTLSVPRADFTAYAAIAVGHPGDPEQLPDDLKARELPSARKPVSQFAFRDSYQPADVPDAGSRG
jgi:nitroreductase